MMGVRFGPHQAEELARAAKAQGCTRGELIRQAVNELLARLAEEGVAS